ncbi:LAME_0F04478g1_1 [Lachancea meyersii CBS 8951]|uniref:Histone H1 n=1 Tax=Lachancea meyersii CBS 8951 TaxID=1266667 RepID=A0A1G4JSF3_9SACH|nr:LAME_0F04478g1_1 [Lachancea meyersii CBS 8951]
MPSRVTSKSPKSSTKPNTKSSAEKMNSKDTKKAAVKTTNKKVTKPTAKAKSPLPTYKEMIMEGIASLSERNGSSRQALKKHIAGKYAVGEGFENHFNLAVRRGIESGDFSQPKGPSGPLKVVKKPTNPKSEHPESKARTAVKEKEGEPTKRRRESVNKKSKEEETPKVRERRRSSASSKSSSANKVTKKPAVQSKKAATRFMAKPVTKPVRSTARRIAAA